MEKATLDQAPNDLLRSRSAIDIVPEEHLNRAGNRADSKVGIDPRKQLCEQVGATVHIADGINPYALRHCAALFLLQRKSHVPDDSQVSLKPPRWHLV